MPDTDIRSAWNLVNPSARPTISKDGCLAFLHILNQRHQGFRIPRTVPASLRSSLERNQIDYQLDRQRGAGSSSRWAASADEATATGRKTKFGDQYLSRLGRSNFKPVGTDFSSEKTEDWEEVRLKRQLHELEAKMERMEEMAQRARGGAQRQSKPALVRRELDQLLDYKRRQLRRLDEGPAGAGAGAAASSSASPAGLTDDLQTVREQVDGLEAHVGRRRQLLEELRRQVAAEKAA